MNTEESMVQGLVERLGIEGSQLTQKVEGKSQEHRFELQKIESQTTQK